MLELYRKLRDAAEKRAKKRKDDDDDDSGPGPSAFAVHIPLWFGVSRGPSSAGVA
jgi:hypothetical protein